MAAADFVQEMRSTGEKLLLKLQKLPQAEPVEIVAFSVILLFTGKLGLSHSPQHPGSSWHPGKVRPWYWPEGWLGVPQTEKEKEMSLGKSQGTALRLDKLRQ